MHHAAVSSQDFLDQLEKGGPCFWDPRDKKVQLR